MIIPTRFYDSPKNQEIVTSFVTDVVSIIYIDIMTKEELFQAINEVSSIKQVTQLAFLYHYPGYDSLPFFHDSRSEGLSSRPKGLSNEGAYVLKNMMITDKLCV